MNPVSGIVCTSVSPDASVAYWKVLAPVFAIVCIVSQWSRVPAGGGAKTRLVIVQLLHSAPSCSPSFSCSSLTCRRR